MTTRFSVGRVRPLALALLSAFLLSSASAYGATIRVDGAGGGDYLTIQEGLDAAAGCDTVVVAAGVYTGASNRALTFGLKNLVLQAESGLPSVTIDCGGLDRAFYLANTGQDTISVIRGFIIENGYTDTYNGGGIYMAGVSVVIEDCIIRDCVASHNGGGVYVGYTGTGPGPQIRNCVFENNSAPYRGGAMLIDHAGATVRTCLFSGNSTTLAGEDFYGGGALCCNWVDDSANYWCTVSRCTFVGNSSAGRGTGVYCWNSAVFMGLSRCIIAFNEGAGLGMDSSPMLDGLVFSIISENEGGDVAPGYSTLVEGDPRFCGMHSGDYTLCANSPALPENNIYDLLIGFADAGCGNCDSVIEEASWGWIKGLYRQGDE